MMNALQKQPNSKVDVDHLDEKEYYIINRQLAICMCKQLIKIHTMSLLQPIQIMIFITCVCESLSMILAIIWDAPEHIWAPNHTMQHLV